MMLFSRERWSARLVAAVGVAGPLAAQFTPQMAKLEAVPPIVFDYFGSSTALSGDTLVVWSNLLVHVFERQAGTWSEQASLWPLTLFPATGGLFGPVDLDRHTLAAGGSNIAYVVVRQGTTWSGQAVLGAPGFPPADQFGTAVAVSGDTIAVGAPGGDGKGRVHVFVRSGTAWTQQAVLVASDGAPGDKLGMALALDGDTLLACTPGAAYAFVRAGSSWTEQAKLTASDGEGSLGNAVALSGDTALLGAQFHDHGAAVNCGAAYVFVRSGSTWNEQQELLPTPLTPVEFGAAVSVDQDRALVGALYHSYPWATSAGTAYQFQRSAGTWTELQKLAAIDTFMHDRFGASVAVEADTIAVGAPAKDHFGAGPADGGPFDSNHGAVYVTGIAQASAQKRLPCGSGAIPSSLKQLAGPPVLGASYAVGVDDPTDAAGLPPLSTLAVLVVTFAPNPNYPCGSWFSGLGTPSGVGKEILVSPLPFGFFPPGYAFVSAPVPWAGPGTPAAFSPFLPPDTGLAGLPLFAQGALVTPIPAGLQIVLTSGIDLVLGV